MTTKSPSSTSARQHPLHQTVRRAPRRRSQVSEPVSPGLGQPSSSTQQSPSPCGIYLTRTKYQLAPPNMPEYIGTPDTTFAGSRDRSSSVSDVYPLRLLHRANRCTTQARRGRIDPGRVTTGHARERRARQNSRCCAVPVAVFRPFSHMHRESGRVRRLA
jgi:hypothetical protein